MMRDYAVSRLIRFGLVGIGAFIVDTALTLILSAVMHYIVANSLAFGVAFTTNFVLAHWFAFGRPCTLESLRHALPGVLAISTSGLILSNLLLWAFHGFMSIELLSAKIISAALVMLWNFTLRHTIIYRGEPTIG